MIFSYASNAVLSKARAMYGKRIRKRDYKNLISCTCVPEIAAYLKNKTSYYKVLESIDERTIHRGKLEEVLRQSLFYDFAKLGRYDLSVGEHFFSYIIARAEIEKIMHTLISLKSKKAQNYSYDLPKIFESHSKIDLPALSVVKNYDEFLLAVKDSPYYSELLKFKPPSESRDLNITEIETALYNHLYKLMFTMVDKYLKGKDRQELKDLFSLYIDLSNLVRITRMKLSYSLSESFILSSLLSSGQLNKHYLQTLVRAKDSKELLQLMKSTKIGRKWIKGEQPISDRVPKTMRFIKCTHNIRFSISPPIVLMSYIFLKEIELSNITKIIEGVRYNVPKEQINAMLIR